MGPRRRANRSMAQAVRITQRLCLLLHLCDRARLAAHRHVLASNGAPDKPFLPVDLWRDFLGLDVPLELRLNDHYGNHTLQNVLDRQGEDLQGQFSYFMGQNGQILYIMPDKNLVVYRAGERHQLLHSTLYGAWNSIAHE